MEHTTINQVGCEVGALLVGNYGCLARKKLWGKFLRENKSRDVQHQLALMCFFMEQGDVWCICVCVRIFVEGTKKIVSDVFSVEMVYFFGVVSELSFRGKC